MLQFLFRLSNVVLDIWIATKEIKIALSFHFFKIFIVWEAHHHNVKREVHTEGKSTHVFQYPWKPRVSLSSSPYTYRNIRRTESHHNLARTYNIRTFQKRRCKRMRRWSDDLWWERRTHILIYNVDYIYYSYYFYKQIIQNQGLQIFVC